MDEVVNIEFKQNLLDFNDEKNLGKEAIKNYINMQLGCQKTRSINL